MSRGPLRALSADSPGREALVMALAAAIMIVLPWLLPMIGGYRELATRVLIWGIFALGFDILVGFTGFLSFGHAAFWGLGAYVAGFYLLHFGTAALPAMILGTGVATAIVSGVRTPAKSPISRSGRIGRASAESRGAASRLCAARAAAIRSDSWARRLLRRLRSSPAIASAKAASVSLASPTSRIAS